MNILLSPSTYLPRSSGVQVTVQNLAKTFMAKGHQVIIVTPKLEHTHPAFEVIDGIEVHRMPFVFPWRLLYENPQEGFLKFCLYGPIAARRLARLMAQKRIEIINVHHFGAHLPYVLFAHLFTNGQTVLTLYGNEFFRLNPSSERMRHFLTNFTLRKARQIITISSHTADEIAQLCSEASGKIVRIPNGVVVDEFSGAASFPFSSRYILSLSRLNSLKGHDVLLKAFQEVAGRERNVHLITAADGPQRIRLHAIAMALGLKDRVTFLGQVSRARVKELLAGCEFLVNCSWVEGIPSAILEAMASGKAVIGTAVGGIPEVVSDFETGRLVPPGDTQALAESMLFLLQNPEQRRAMGERGRVFVKAHYDFAPIAERYLAVYQKVLREGKRHC